MGLDVTAYSRCRFVHGPEDQTEACYDDLDHLVVSIDPSFVAQFAGLEEGCYVSDGQAFGFRGGSYSGYNRWREQLCRLALGVEPEEVWKYPERFAGRPFVELVNFTDCDGTIGPVTAAKLLSDFEAGCTIATVTGDDYFAGKYAEWTRAFRIASDGGLVRFH